MTTDSPTTALRRLCLRERENLQALGLQRGVVVSELRRLHRRRVRFPRRLRPARRHQDADPEPEFRQPRERLPDCRQHDEERGDHEFLQGLDAEVVDDGAEAGVQFLVGADADSGV